MFPHDSTKKSRRSTKIGRNPVRATGDIAYQFQSQKVKGQGNEAALGACSSHRLQGAGALMRRPHYKAAQLVQTALDILITHILDAVGNVVGNFYGRVLLVAGK